MICSCRPAANGWRTMTLDEIKALTPDVIATLPTQELESLLDAVRRVEAGGPKTPELEAEISAAATTTHQALSSELLTRSNRLCGGLAAPYLSIRWPETSAKPEVARS